MQRQIQTLTDDGDVKGEPEYAITPDKSVPPSDGNRRDGWIRKLLAEPPADPDTSAASAPEPDEPTIVE